MIGVALVASSLIALFLLHNNWKRSQQSVDSLTLTPNCLLTRHPLVFISGPKTPFYFLKYWNTLPDYLREHGFDVIEVNLPWRGLEARQEALRKSVQRITESHRGLHLIADASTENELLWLNQAQPDQVQSYNVVSNQKPKNTVRSQDLRPGYRPLHYRAILEPQSTSWKNLPWTSLLCFHMHRLCLYPNPCVPAPLLGLSTLDKQQQIRQHFLEMAKQLAEEDLLTKI